MESISVLAICGSLRRDSLNRQLMLNALDLAPDHLEFRVAEISGLPLYNADIESVGFPDAATNLHQQLCASDAVLIITPEYNYSIPAPLKNAIDWLSRFNQQGFNNKPVAIMGASPGRLGTARCQYHLRQVLVCLNAWVLNRPEIMISGAHLAFDEQGKLKERATQDRIREQLIALAAMVH
ncbi:NADPH-dependent FMN reductase [Ferrimonas balearica]|uniref:NADPH-dependent FMN reductase n=1 Tax=Ferrimonas balearica TaxID=44012 RepID=UPI001C98FC25|nr:NAD(P)H-dependent oxidoreductase [Ferrimonas balearica]MBY5921320.1 NAD(P)H-dependent oxidoreductase [Ferrimonas balearica]MBY5995995.1 NAD(P)H-dependent oxidoreductase [Ferrimonas balearica]